jgi:H+/gluconate symporter-like permease
MQDPMRSHRRKEGAAWAVALLGVIIAVPTFFFSALVGWGVLVAFLAWACWIYYR